MGLQAEFANTPDRLFGEGAVHADCKLSLQTHQTDCLEKVQCMLLVVTMLTRGCHTLNTMSPPSSMTAGLMRVSSSSLIIATTSLSSSLIAVSDFSVLLASVTKGSPVTSAW